MLYVTKAKKFGMTAIMGFLIGLIMVFFGNGYLTMVTGLVGGLLADVILKKADYKSAKSTVLSCGVFSIWVFGNFAPIFLNRESYMVMLTEGYGAEWQTIFSCLIFISKKFPHSLHLIFSTPYLAFCKSSPHAY